MTHYDFHWHGDLGSFATAGAAKHIHRECSMLSDCDLHQDAHSTEGSVKDKGCCDNLLKWLKSRFELKLSADGSIDISAYLVINHNSAGYLGFNFFVTICCLLSSYTYVYMAAHRISLEDNAKEGLNFTVFAMYSFEAVFALDMGANFLLSYEYSGEAGRFIERRVSVIADHYFKSNFLKDLIPILPF